MKELILKESGFLKIKKSEIELKIDDIEDAPTGLIPGEWSLFHYKKANKFYVGFTNLYCESPYKVKILKEIENNPYILNASNIELIIIKSLIDHAKKKRVSFKDLQNGFRLIHGGQDQLPGLIVDIFSNIMIIQINTAGIDRFRDEIKKYLEEIFQNKKAYFLDNEAFRKNEMLPGYKVDPLPEIIKVVENEFNYEVHNEAFQKIGFYYDHRMNRKKLESYIHKMDRKYKFGLDLFSYVGSWGLHLLRAGVEHVTFVDQGDMSGSISRNCELNKLENRSQFIRRDVFKYLDEVKDSGTMFDVIVSDPPAFTKSEKNKANAILGYEKLHTKCLAILAEEGLFVAASCTHYLSLEELDKTVQVGARKNGIILQMLDLGLQSPDHPIKSFSDKGNYIKYILYKRV